MVNAMFPNGKTSNCRNRKGLNAVEKKVPIFLPINYSDTIFEVVRCYKSVYSNDDISSAYGQIANAMGYIEHYCRKAEINDSLDIEIPYDKALYLFDAISVVIDELGKGTDNIIALRSALGKLVNR